MQVHVAFTPDEAAAAPTGIVVDVIRATSTIAQALAAGYERVLCVPEIEQARALRAELPDSLVGGERDAVRIEGFDVGASPREFLEPRAATLILSTTNGTRTIPKFASRASDCLLKARKALGDALYRRGVYEEATEQYRRAVELRPDLGDDVFLKLGNIAYKAGERRSAVELWTQALDINPENGIARTNLELVQRVLAERKV